MFTITTFNTLKKAFSSFWYAHSETSRLWSKNLDGDYEGFLGATKEMCSMNLDEVVGAKLFKTLKIFFIFFLI